MMLANPYITCNGKIKVAVKLTATAAIGVFILSIASKPSLDRRSFVWPGSGSTIGKLHTENWKIIIKGAYNMAWMYNALHCKQKEVQLDGGKRTNLEYTWWQGIRSMGHLKD